MIVINWKYLKSVLGVKKRDAEAAEQLYCNVANLQKWCCIGLSKRQNIFLGRCKKLNLDFNKLFTEK